MKKSFMTRVLATGLSVAMAFSLSTATNLVSAEAASKPVLVDYTTGGSGKAMTVNVGKTAKIKVNKATKKNYKIASVKVSSNKIRAAKNKAGTVVTVRGVAATPAGKAATIKVSFKSKKTGKTSKYTFISKVTVKAKGNDVTATLTNALSKDYPNTVLQSENAVINVKYEKNGKPVAGETVVFSVTRTAGRDDFEIKGSSTAATNSKGIASFVIGPKTAIKANEMGKKAAYKYTATVASNGEKCTGEVAFARVHMKELTNLNRTTAMSNLAPSVNDNHGGDGLADTKGTATYRTDDVTKDFNPDYVEYVASQQVSTSSVDHKVGFQGAYPYIDIPGTASDYDAAKKFVQDVNISSDPYHVYAGKDDAKYINLNVNPQELTYATLNFSSLNLSRYTRLVIEEYKNETDAKASKDPVCDATVINGATNQTSFSYQIKLNNAVNGLTIKVYVESEGQVDTDNNKGYVIKDITGNYKTQTTTGGGDKPLNNASVKWEVVTPSYSETKTLKDAEYVRFKDATSVDLKNTYNKVTYQVPVFPFTGNAVLTCFDANGKVKAYYAWPTKNNESNVNILDMDVAEKDIYEISEEEANNHNVGEIVSQTADTVIVDSQKAGTTNLKGTITVNGTVLDALDENSRYAYTSVQWNPVEKAASTNDAFLALSGQYIDVVAQLVDKNGNAVASQNKNVTFKYYNKAADETKTIGSSETNISAADNTSVAVVSVDAKTNVKGQATLRVKAADVKTLLGVCAESAESSFDVVLKLADKETAKADLYWVDADLHFTASNVATDMPTPNKVSTDKNNTRKTVTGIGDKTGTNWEYGVQTKSANLRFGALDGKSVSINNLGIIMKKDADAVGTVNTNTGRNGVATATSTKTGFATIISRIDSTSLTDNVTFTVDGTEVPCVGKGSTNIERQLDLEVHWQNNGLTAEFVKANGTTVDLRSVGGTKNVYVKVTDTNGNAVPDKKVEFSLDDTTGGVTIGAITAPKTDADGIATVTLSGVITSKRYVVSAKVEGLDDQVISQSYTFANATKDFALDTDLNIDKTAYKSTVTGSSVTLCMTDEVEKNSVKADQFKAAYDGKELAVASVNVDGKYVTLNLKNVKIDDVSKPVVVTASAFAVDGITYQLTSVQGVALPNNTTFEVYAKKEVPTQDTATNSAYYTWADGRVNDAISAINANATSATYGAIVCTVGSIYADVEMKAEITTVTSGGVLVEGTITEAPCVIKANATSATGAGSKIVITFKHKNASITKTKTYYVRHDASSNNVIVEEE